MGSLLNCLFLVRNFLLLSENIFLPVSGNYELFF